MDADSTPTGQTQKKISVVNPNMDIKAVQAVKPNQRRRYSLTKSNLKEKVMSVTLLSSLQTVSMSSGCCRVESWAREFDNLLSDPEGLRTFTEFLKKEFSAENIYFWCICEKYRMTSTMGERHTIAREIVERHLDAGAPEPVNVDSMARSCAQQILSMTEQGKELERDMFVAPQKQIYNLMKFDSYGRFLKSDLYNACLAADMKGKKLPLAELDKADRELFTCLHQNQNISERRIFEPRTRRKSFLPWPYKSKSKEKLISKSTEELDKRERKKSLLEVLTPSLSEYQLSSNSKRNSRSCSDVCSESDNNKAVLCRVTLPDSSSTMACLEHGQSVLTWVQALLTRRGFLVCDVVVQDMDSGVELDTARDCSRLANREIIVRCVSDSDSAPHTQLNLSQDSQDYTQYSPALGTGPELVPDCSGADHVPEADLVPEADHVPEAQYVPGADHCQGSFQNRETSADREKESSCWFDNAGLEVEGE